MTLFAFVVGINVGVGLGLFVRVGWIVRKLMEF